MRSPVAGPVALLTAVLAGVAMAEGRGLRPGPGAALGAIVALATAVVVRLGRPDPVRPARVAGALVLAGVGCAVLAAASTGRALDGARHSPLSAAVAGHRRADVVVTLVGDPAATRFSARVLGRVDRFRAEGRRWRSAGRIVTVDATGPAATRLVAAGAGDRLLLRGAFRPLDRFEEPARWRHAVGAFAADDLASFRGPADPLRRAALGVRSTVARGVGPLPEPQRALVRGFLLGGATGLPDEVVADFRAAGLSHLVVVSGENVAFVLVLVGPLLRRLPRPVRLVFALGVLTVFAATTRFEPSVLRASVMAACALVAGAVGRPTSGLRLLVLAVAVLVAVDPFLVHSVGFRLSVAATVGIAVGARPIARRLPGPRALAEAVGVTVAAQLAVAPVLVATFGSVPLVALPANLAAAPFVGPLTVSGLAGALLGGVVPLRLVGAVVGFPAWVGASVVLAIASASARFPLEVGWPGLGLVVASGAGMFVVGRSRRATWARARTAAPRPP